MTAISKEGIDSRLQRIADVLLLNTSFINNFGLLNGKMGIVIFFYHYARYTGNNSYSDFAGELLDEIFEEINYNAPIDFENGLLGIGWGIEFLLQNGFVKGNANKILIHFDDWILRGILSKPLSISDTNELYGVGFYYLARLRNKDDSAENLALLRIKSHMITLLEECKIYLTKDKLFGKPIIRLSTEQLCSITFYLTETYRLKLYPSLNKKLLIKIPEYFSKRARTSDSLIDQFTLNQLISNISKLTVLPKYNSNIILSTEGKLTEGENAISDFVKCVYLSLLYQLEYKDFPNLKELKEASCNFIENEENWTYLTKKTDNISLCIGKGLAGIGLSLLFYLNQN